METSEACSQLARRVLDELREEFRAAGQGELRRVSLELGLQPDHLATMINRGYMDVGAESRHAVGFELDLLSAKLHLSGLLGLVLCFGKQIIPHWRPLFYRNLRFPDLIMSEISGPRGFARKLRRAH